MSTGSARSSENDNPPTAAEPSGEARMSFGDHLEELRTRLIFSLLGVAVTTAICFYFGKSILEIICQPLLYVQYRNGLSPNIQVLAPTAAFTAYLKIAILSGLILGMPWVLFQIWRFVATGLYVHERRFVRWLAPVSIALFAIGVMFLYFIVLPVVLHFLINFNRGFDIPSLTPTALQKVLLRGSAEEPPVVDAPELELIVPIVDTDPKAPPTGSVWFNSTTRRLIVQGQGSVWSARMERGDTGTVMESQFAIDFYISFVLMLALAFGIAFETPIVVFFLAWSGLVSIATMTSGRRYVLLGVFVLSAILTPPDMLSQVMLAVPMYLLFELGILAARLVERKRGVSGR